MDLEGKFQKDEIARALAGLKLRRDFDDLQAEISGISSGRQARFLQSGQASAQAKARAREAQARVDADIFYLTLINDGQLGSHIAGEIFEGKSDWQIFDIVAQIEAKTGMPFEEYAAGILGAEAAQRHSGESEAEYKRHVLKSLTEEMLEADGSIKAQYANDPLAEIIRSDDAYWNIMDDVAQINRGGPSHAADTLVAAYKKASYGSAETSAEHIENDGYKNDLRDGQHDHRAKKRDNRSASSSNADFIGEMPLDETLIGKAADTGRGTFNVVATDAAPEPLETAVPSSPTPSTKPL